MRHAPMPVAYCRTQDSQMLKSLKVLGITEFMPLPLPSQSGTAHQIVNRF